MAENNTALARIEKQTELAKRVDEIAHGAMAILAAPQSFVAELQLARALVDLRLALAPEVMEPVMALQNTKLGFLTDQPYKSAAEPGGYPAEVVRDVLIEAKLRGYHATGNEFNIIKGQFYAAKNGLRRKVQELVTDLKETYGAPRIGQGGAEARVLCGATWKRDGKPDKIENEDIPIRIQERERVSVDALLGKAERKLLARILRQVSGAHTPDGDVEDAGGAVIDIPETRTAPPSPPPATARAPRPETAPCGHIGPKGQTCSHHVGHEGLHLRNGDSWPSASAVTPLPTPPAATPPKDEAKYLDATFGPDPEDAAHKRLTEALITELATASSWATVEPLGERMRALPPQWADLVLDAYIGRVIALADTADQVELDKVVAELGRLRRSKAMTEQQLKSGTDKVKAATKRLAGAA